MPRTPAPPPKRTTRKSSITSSRSSGRRRKPREPPRLRPQVQIRTHRHDSWEMFPYGRKRWTRRTWATRQVPGRRSSQRRRRGAIFSAIPRLGRLTCTCGTIILMRATDASRVPLTASTTPYLLRASHARLACSSCCTIDSCRRCSSGNLQHQKRYSIVQLRPTAVDRIVRLPCRGETCSRTCRSRPRLRFQWTFSTPSRPSSQTRESKQSFTRPPPLKALSKSSSPTATSSVEIETPSCSTTSRSSTG